MSKALWLSAPGRKKVCWMCGIQGFGPVGGCVSLLMLLDDMLEGGIVNDVVERSRCGTYSPLLERCVSFQVTLLLRVLAPAVLALRPVAPPPRLIELSLRGIVLALRSFALLWPTVLGRRASSPWGLAEENRPLAFEDARRMRTSLSPSSEPSLSGSTTVCLPTTKLAMLWCRTADVPHILGMCIGGLSCFRAVSDATITGDALLASSLDASESSPGFLPVSISSRVVGISTLLIELLLLNMLVALRLALSRDPSSLSAMAGSVAVAGRAGGATLSTSFLLKLERTLIRSSGESL
mmetsp:Transcript_35398/g.111378  ORF Transcript_35398/g.111378 Transcript_35398/m.111378 type:complete len:295 (+) Transcript_35398:2224-3108(+)